MGNSNIRPDKCADLILLAARKPLRSSGTPNSFIASTSNPSKPSQVNFDRKELTAILHIYGFKVADGEWRDYTIDLTRDRALFSVYSRTSEAPLFIIEKDPKLARKQGMYSIVGTNGNILRRGHDLQQVLKFFERRLKLVR